MYYTVKYSECWFYDTAFALCTELSQCVLLLISPCSPRSHTDAFQSLNIRLMINYDG